jgi:hypothetical protein
MWRLRPPERLSVTSIQRVLTQILGHTLRVRRRRRDRFNRRVLM